MKIADLKEVITDQRETLERIFKKENIIERELKETYEKFLKSNLVKIVTGARRCGKSILCFQLLENKKYGYINFDDERLAGLKAENLNDVLQVFYELYGEIDFVLLDEIQNIKGWELFVNRLNRMRVNVLLTGSNAKLLSKELATHLTGRHLPLELFPFSFREFLVYHGINIPKKTSYTTKEKALIRKNLASYAKIGGFPEALKNKDLAKTYLSALYSTILTKDIILRHDIRLKKTFKEVSNYLVSSFSSLISFNKIKNIFNLKSSHTSGNYASYLEDAYLIFLVNKFSFKHKEVLLSPKKVYVIDTGLINTLSFRFMKNIGKVMENMVAVELKRKACLDPNTEIYYWKDYSGKETDFVIKRRRKITRLIQVCWDISDSKTREREIKGLLASMKEFKLKKGLIITSDYEGLEIINRKEIRFIPLWKWLLKGDFYYKN